jgi:hypothetical protein
MMAEQKKDPESTTGQTDHVIAVTQEDNGELAEDVVAAEETKDGSELRGGARRVADRVVETSPAPDAEGRERPDNPVPGTLAQQ